jgi:hypothetical protein
MSAYTVYQELFPPQTVEQVETSHFTSPDAVNLVVAKASLLQIYEFVEYVPEQAPSEKPLQEEEDTLVSNTELASERLNDNEDVVKYRARVFFVIFRLLNFLEPCISQVKAQTTAARYEQLRKVRTSRSI